MICKHFVLAMASSPPVPLDGRKHVWNLQEMFRFAQHDNKIIMHTASCHCEAIAEAINRRRILMILASHTVDCHARAAHSQ